MNIFDDKIFIFVFVSVVFLFGGILYLYNPEPIEYKNPTEKPETICTMDVKLCPDGSYVGREGPNCEFKNCPLEKSTATSTQDTPTNPATPIIQ